MDVVLHDFAACVLASLEAWMLTASPAMISLSTLTDTSEFTGVAIPPYSAEDDAGRTKRKYARVQKLMGDYSLLAGSPLDAVDHYNTAVELGRASLDFTIAAAAIEGYVAAKLLHAAVSNDAFLINAASVFRDESAWRSPRNSIGMKSGDGDTTSEGEIERTKRTTSSSTRAPKSPHSRSPSPVESFKPPQTPGEETGGDTISSTTSPTTSSLREDEELNTTTSPSPEHIEDANDTEMMLSTTTTTTTSFSEPLSSQGTEQVFDGHQFWDALRRNTGLEEEIRSLIEEAKGFIRKRGGLPLLVEADLRWARLLAGLHGCNARSEATELANAVQLAAEMLPLPEDRLIALTESANILGTVGAVRKRVLLMWQAVELSKYFGFPDARTLAVARSALEPAIRFDNQEEYSLMDISRGGSGSKGLRVEFAATSSSSSSLLNGSSSRFSGVLRNDDWDLSRPRPLDQETTIPASWGSVRAGCLEATLGLAIYAKRHCDVFDAAAALLRDHSKELSTHRMQSLLDNLVAAASQMAVGEKARPGRGPPPLLHVMGPRAVPDALAPLWIQPLGNDEGNNNNNNHSTTSSDYLAAQSPSSRQNIFLYDPFSAKRQKERNELRKKKGAASMSGLGTGVSGIGGGGIEGLLGEIDSGIQWVSGEPAVVDIEVANPSSVSIKIDKMVLEATFIPLASSKSDTSSDTAAATAGASGTPPPPPPFSFSQTRILPVTATKSIWKGKPVSLNIPAHTKPVRIQLEGTPLVPGILILTGCRLTAFGGVSWSQPWTGKPLNLAKKLAEASNKKRLLGKEVLSVAKSETGAATAADAVATTTQAVVETMIPIMKGPAVTILPSLPRLKLELHSADDDASRSRSGGGVIGRAAGSIPESEKLNKDKVSHNSSSSKPMTLLKLVHGQSVRTQLVIRNTGSVAIDTLRIGFGNNDGKAVDGRLKNNGVIHKPISVDMDTSTLRSLLPLQPGQSISLPVLCRALGSRFTPTAATVRNGGGGEMPSAAEHQHQPCIETIDVEYASLSTQNPDTSSSGTGNGPITSALLEREIPGRRAMLDIEIAVAPSLHVSQIDFAEVYQQQQQEDDDTTTSNQGCTSTRYCERKVIMLADVVNRGSTILKAWLGPISGGTAISTGTGETKKSENHVVVLPPGQRAALSYLLNINKEDDGAPLVAAAVAADTNNLLLNLDSCGTTYISNNNRVRGGRNANNAVILRYEERERQMCASFLAERIGLYFSSSIDTNKSSSGVHGGGDDILQQSSTAAIDDDSTTTTITLVSGSMPLSHGEIYNGITPSVLCMLRPCAISLRFSVAPLDREAGIAPAIENDSTTSIVTPNINNNNNLTDPVPMGSVFSDSGYGSLLVHPSALRASLGQPLKVTIEVESHVDEATEVFCSFMCTPVFTPVVYPIMGAGGATTGAGGRGGAGVVDSSPSLHTGGGSGVDSTLVSQGSLGAIYSPSAAAAASAGVGLGFGGLNGNAATGLPATASSAAASAATWVGIHSRLQISVPAKGKITHVAGVAIVAPGRYRIGTGHASVTYGPEAISTEGDDGSSRGGGTGGDFKNTLVSITPCFVSVE